jgi:hypothetical protein
MFDRKFSIIGYPVPPMIGRQSMIESIVAALTKPMPDHLQVVGPRFAGKTVLLHDLARRLRGVGKPYTAIMLWDLGHQTPASDEVFTQRLARELADAMADKHADYAEHLRQAKANAYQDIAEVLDVLKGENGKILAILDGFDKPLSNGKLTRNLWDQLRELAAKPSFRIVTASRSTLRELIRNPEAQTSDFWNIFDPSPARVGCFDEADLDAVIAQMPGIRLSAGARTELWNTTNGSPVMLLEVLNILNRGNASCDVSDAMVVEASRGAYPSLMGAIESMWNDCSSSSRDLLLRVRGEKAVARGSGVANADAEALIERGFVVQAGNKLLRPNRLLTLFLEDRPDEGNALARLFSTKESYDKHVKEVLLRRVAQIAGLDPTLKRFLERAAADLPEHPEVFFTNVRGMVDQVFELICKAELGRKAVPSEWMMIWKANQERGIDNWLTSFPMGGQRLRFVNLMTGTERSARCAKHITRTTYVLMEAANSFGDFGQHQEGAPVTAGTAYAALNVCIELAASIASDLAKGVSEQR